MVPAPRVGAAEAYWRGGPAKLIRKCLASQRPSAVDERIRIAVRYDASPTPNLNPTSNCETNPTQTPPQP